MSTGRRSFLKGLMALAAAPAAIASALARSAPLEPTTPNSPKSSPTILPISYMTIVQPDGRHVMVKYTTDGRTLLIQRQMKLLGVELPTSK